MSSKNELLIGSILTVLFLGAIVFFMPAKSQTIKSSAPISPTPTTQPTINQVSNSATFSVSDVAKHSSQNNCWIIISGKIYDVSDYLFSHPGGSQAITPYCGADATEAFTGMIKHDSRAQAALATIFIGLVK